MLGDVFSGIEVIPLQQQPNGCDCGVFSIAFATCFVFQVKPESVQFLNNEKKNPNWPNALGHHKWSYSQ